MVEHHLPLHYFEAAVAAVTASVVDTALAGVDHYGSYGREGSSTTTQIHHYDEHHHHYHHHPYLRHHHPHHRDLTFLDDSTDTTTGEEAAATSGFSSEEIGFISGYAVLAAGFVLLGIMSARAAWTCQELYEWNAIRLILPAVAIVMSFECVTLAYSVAKQAVPSQWAIAAYMLEATVAPGLFIFTFVLTFLSYRIRSMPFCFVYRGPSRQAAGEPYQDEDEEVVQPLVRPAVLIVGSRLFSLFLLVLALVVNFDVVWSEDDLAGRTGWATLFQDPTNPNIDHIILALVPMGLTCIACLYFSLLLWRYGCEFSMVIYPSVFNPWMYPLIGTACMITGQFFGPKLFPILSNLGIFLFMTSIVRILFEVRHDIEQSSDLGQFLSALGKDRIANTVSGVEKATNGETASTGRFDGTLSASMLGSLTALPNTGRPSSVRKEDEQIVGDIEDSSSPSETEFAAQRFEGIAKRPPKLEAGQKPDKAYVVL
mmetsp:Transcript_40013/g.96615  ORF Transcript_40013/g.96615 Transcript_40013/m.96615 type:complete len:484 (-) Transcript_40013:49-1500(-)